MEKQILIYFENNPSPDEQISWKNMVKDYFDQNGGEIVSVTERQGSWLLDVVGFIKANETASFFIGATVSGVIGWGVAKMADTSIEFIRKRKSSVQDDTESCTALDPRAISLEESYTNLTKLPKKLFVSERTILLDSTGVPTYHERCVISGEQGVKEYTCCSEEKSDIDSFRESLINRNFSNLSRLLKDQ